MENELEEFEFRARAEKEAGRRSPKKMYDATGFTKAAPEKGQTVTGSSLGTGGLMGAMKSIDKGIYDLGGHVTDLSSKAGASPEVSGGLGYATNVALQSLPMMFGGEAGGAAKVPLQSLAKDLMQSAVKPTLKQLKSGDAEVAIDTMLKEGLNPTKGGVDVLKSKISALNDQIGQVIQNSPETVRKSDVGQRLIQTLEQAKKQVNPQADVEAVKQAWLDFRNHPLLKGKADIPVQLAQELKQGTYRQLAKKYGQMGGAEVEAQKGLARGLKEEIAAKVPEVAGLNAEETKLIRTLNVVERRALMELNKNPMGLSLLSSKPEMFAAFMADKSALFKSLAARMIYPVPRPEVKVRDVQGWR